MQSFIHSQAPVVVTIRHLCCASSSGSSVTSTAQLFGISEGHELAVFLTENTSEVVIKGALPRDVAFLLLARRHFHFVRS
jgi:hypothetical protein